MATLVRYEDIMRTVAKLVALSTLNDLDEEERALVAQGKLYLPEEPVPDTFFSMPAPRVSRKKAVAAVSWDRDID